MPEQLSEYDKTGANNKNYETAFKYKLFKKNKVIFNILTGRTW